MAVDDSGNIAVLIDADNVSPKVIVGLMAEIANYGTASVRRIYGDWTSPYMNTWKMCLLDHSITPIQQFAYTTGKNATDGAMIIDAMDLMYTGRFTKFCIVSSDSDFTRLASRIREQGITVCGFGERRTVNAFIAACDKFVYFDVLPMPGDEQVDREGDVPIAPQMSLPIRKIPTGPAALMTRPQNVFRVDPPKRPIDQAALDGLKKAINRCVSFEDDYANLADVGSHLVKISPDLNARNYGYEKLREFVMTSGIAELKWKSLGDHPPMALVRLNKDESNRPLGNSPGFSGHASSKNAASSTPAP
ncbi:uncharacterized protein EKO05_0010545 [Ascochyta rabiei]|uniref:Uncharacterized protein n=1 Tax=Didymella rabiei TaxID=5454 RepID=A0A163KCR6_DIDRA|nr:uncharacterized protein EKO05_0010545 [Ascochyta rabiei]KZM26917.1 hypothetical protein ST47_g1935 [Ascochyta rabiei]UPX20309.1 hypothetical protein EKO05_0010545 [Ascochyta rabiei]